MPASWPATTCACFPVARADQTQRYWPITIGGYVLQMSVVPLLTLVLAVSHGQYKLAFASPAVIMLSLLAVARVLYPRPQDLSAGPAQVTTSGLPRVFWVYLSAAYAPLVFLGGFWAGLAGVSLWGLGMGVQESIIPAAVAPMVSADRRASAYGLFTGAYGIAWFLGSVAIGALFSVSLGAVVAFCVAAEILAIPLILRVSRQMAPAT